MQLKPLKQWYCDKCGEIIEKPKDGWYEYKLDDGRGINFKIVHHDLASPRKGENKCHFYGGQGQDTGGSGHLNTLLGVDGLSEYLSWLDMGEMYDSTPAPKLRDIREYVEIFRRLHVPHYEEARMYFDQAIQDGFWDLSDQTLNTDIKSLKKVIAEYSER